jgi:hypothetical protein
MGHMRSWRGTGWRAMVLGWFWGELFGFWVVVPLWEGGTAWKVRVMHEQDKYCCEIHVSFSYFLMF